MSCFKQTTLSNLADLILTASLKVGNLGFSPGRRGSNGFGLPPLEPPPPDKAVESSFLNLGSVRLTTCRLNTKPLKLGFFPISFFLGKICLFECCHSLINVSDPFFQLSNSLTCLGSSFQQFELQLLWIPCMIAWYYFGAKSLYWPASKARSTSSSTLWGSPSCDQRAERLASTTPCQGH